LKQFESFSLQHSSRPPLDLLPYQRLSWLLDSQDKQKVNVALTGLIQDAVHIWQQRQWRSSVTQASLFELFPTRSDKPMVISNGSLNLFESVESLACLNILCSVDHIGADMYDDALAQMKNLKSFLLSHTQSNDRRVLELCSVIASAHQLFTAAIPMLSEDLASALSPLMDQVRAFAQTLDSYTNYVTQPDFEKVREILSSIVKQLEARQFNKDFIKTMSFISKAVEQYRLNRSIHFLVAIGKARVCLGSTFIACYVPDYPADPTSESRLSVDLLNCKKQQYTQAIDTRAKIETMITGNSTNPTISSYQAALQDVDQELAQNLTTFSLRPEKSQLNDIFVDLRYLQAGLVEKSVTAFIDDFDRQQPDNETATTALLQREQLIQDNAQQFVDRLQAKYPLYRDMLQPLLVAVDDIKRGLRLMTSLPRHDGMDAFVATVTRLFIAADSPLPANVNSPDTVSPLHWRTLATTDQLLRLKTVIFERAPTSRKWSFYLRFLVVAFQQLMISISHHGFLKADDLDCLNTLFSEIVVIHKAALAYKRQKEAEKEQLFKTRTKKYQPTTEEEQEEQDRKQLFADFNEAFADLALNDTDDAPPSANSLDEDVKEESVLDDHDIQRIGDLHRTLFEQFDIDLIARQPPSPVSSALQKQAQRAYQSAGQLSRLSTTAFDVAVDRQCQLSHLRMTKLAIDRLEADVSSDDAIYDFYTSENIAETKLVAPVILRFKDRLQFILTEWPEHIILQQLVTICDRILGFDITSPVAKFMTGFEILLQKSEDWQAYAAKHVSIQAQRDEVVAMIVRWRQLELNCWPKLLAAQEQVHKSAVYEHWFHMYDAVQHARLVPASSDDESVDTQKNLEELLGALDQFMQTASLIQFKPRLALIDSFYRQVSVQARLYNDDNDAMVATILRNAHQYYQQFAGHADTMLAQLRKPIEKELKDFVKIATWKDVNVYALRQSAQKTHRQLHKCIRKYREVLQTSMLMVIANYNEERAMFQYGDEKKYNDRYDSLLHQLTQPSIWSSPSTNQALPAPPAAVISFNDRSTVKPHLLDLDATLRKVIKVCQQSIWSGPTQGVLLEPFMDEILGQIKHFQKETPATLTEENKSQVKHLKLLKKKALVDLLKEFKRLGLRWRASAALLEQNADTSRLFKTRTPCLERILLNPMMPLSFKSSSLSTSSLSLTGFCKEPVEDMLAVWHRADDYFYRCVARLSHMRSVCTTQVSKDVSLLEVEKSTAATEHLFSLVTKERSVLSKLEDKLYILQGAALQLEQLKNATPTADLLPADLNTQLAQHKSRLDHTVVALRHAMQLLSMVKQGAMARGFLHDMQRDIHQAQQRIDVLYGQLSLHAQASTGVVVMSSNVLSQLNDNATRLLTLKTNLENQLTSAQPIEIPILQPVLDSLTLACTLDLNAALIQDQPDEAASLSSLLQYVNDIVDATLVAVQDLKKAADTAPEMKPAPATTDEDDEQDPDAMNDDYIKKQHDHQFTLLSALHLDSMVHRVVGLLQTLQQLDQQASVSMTDAHALVSQALPYVHQYLLLSQHTLGDILLRHKAMAKMNYCMINSFTLIIAKGFCSPEGMEDDEADSGDMDGQMTAGTGIGEGEGAKDVSEEIEDEEQVLGTQNDEPSKDENKSSKEEKNGLDMENDFDGELEDVEHDDQDEQDSDSDSDDEEDPDEQIGDVDDMDPDAVDDKMWGDENAEDQLRDSDKTVDQQQQQQGEADIVAQEEEETSDQPPPNKDQQPDDQPQQQDDSTDQQQQGDEQDGDEGEDDNQDGADDNPAGEQMQADIPEADTLELPDDMEMDADANDQGEDQMDAFQDPLDEAPQDTQEAMAEDQDQQDVPMDEEDDGSGQVKDDDAAAEDANDDDNNESPGEDDEAGEDQPAGDMDEQKQQQGQLMDDDQDEDDELHQAQNREQPMSDNQANNQLGVRGETGKSSLGSQGKQDNTDDDQKNDDQDAAQNESTDQDQAGAADSGRQQQQQEPSASDDLDKTNEQQTKQSNPERSLGDALENWRRRLRDVTDQPDDDEEGDDKPKQDNTKEDQVQVKEDHSFEYVKNDEESHDMQTMGDAQADQTQDFLKDVAAMDEDTADDNQVAAEQPEEPSLPEETNALDAMPSAPESLLRRDDNEETSGAGDDHRGGAIVSKQLNRDRQDPFDLDEDALGLTIDEAVIAREPLDDQDIERMRDDLEAKVALWREEGRDMTQARNLWQGYENLTHDLAMGLCEQLRLILEPTLATKLKGDYRTGKRLNMKKIIPYIASQFKKDKIWLRRTKPSKRQYQVMISIDDSKSMSENHSVQLAYEALSLIAKAMSQLEVGDISITSFGESVRLLHPFDQPFTSESGAQVLQQFTFAQQKTYINKLVQSSLNLFDNARHSHSSSDLWQLQLIISDGICEDHESLQALVRQAMDQRVMIIFIVLDNKPEKDSILSMTNVKYVTTNGKLSMKMTPYLETFPFQYFMVLRDINSLPEALADALRQYFSFVAS
ncbi:hypothetical protein DM01DRAFT_1278333, partial [Hesseltinella vesiculosa]